MLANAGRLLLLVVVVLAPVVSAGKGPRLETDQLAFAFSDLDGNPVRSTDPRFAGKVLLVDLWGTWCPPCLSEIPSLNELHRKHGERGLVIVAIAFEDEAEEEAARRTRLREFVEYHGIEYLVLDGVAPLAGDDGLPGLTGVKGLPVEIVVDRDGTAVDVRNGYGYSKRWFRRLDRELTELLEREPSGDAN